MYLILELKISIQNHMVFAPSDHVIDLKIDLFGSNLKYAKYAPLYTTVKEIIIRRSSTPIIIKYLKRSLYKLLIHCYRNNILQIIRIIKSYSADDFSNHRL